MIFLGYHIYMHGTDEYASVPSVQIGYVQGTVHVCGTYRPINYVNRGFLSKVWIAPISPFMKLKHIVSWNLILRSFTFLAKLLD